MPFLTGLHKINAYVYAEVGLIIPVTVDQGSLSSSAQCIQDVQTTDFDKVLTNDSEALLLFSKLPKVAVQYNHIGTNRKLGKDNSCTILFLYKTKPTLHKPASTLLRRKQRTKNLRNLCRTCKQLRTAFRYMHSRTH